MQINPTFLTNYCKNTAIDSMVIFTPIKLFVLPENFYHDILTVNNTTGQILDESIKPVIYEKHGIKIRADVRNFFGVEMLCIGVSSKLLEKNYLHGIGLNNFYQVFQFFKNALDVKISYARYLANSKVFDMDIKTDFEISHYEFHNFTLIHKPLPIVRFFRSKNQRYLDKPMNNGMQFINRNDASISQPFIKFYSKYDELTERSKEFYYHFGIKAPKNLRRFECTVKNNASFKALGIENDLHSVLSLTGYQLDNILFTYYLKHFPKTFIYSPPDIKTTISLQDWITLSLVFEISQTKKIDIPIILAEILDSYPTITPPSKSRKIKQLKAKMSKFIEIQNKFDLRRFIETPETAFFK